MVSYVIAPDGASITCGRCGATSHNPEDVAQHYCGECHRFHDDVQQITFYVVYDHPSDYPNDYVLRKQAMVFVPGKRPFEVQDKACQVGTLAEMRKFIPPAAYPIGRHAKDDPVILEVWML